MSIIEIEERGNGFPRTGEIIGYWDEGEPILYRVGEDAGPIQTQGQSGRGNTCCCHAERVDADDVADEIDIEADDLGLRMVGIVTMEGGE